MTRERFDLLTLAVKKLEMGLAKLCLYLIDEAEKTTGQEAESFALLLGSMRTLLAGTRDFRDVVEDIFPPFVEEEQSVVTAGDES